MTAMDPARRHLFLAAGTLALLVVSITGFALIRDPGAPLDSAPEGTAPADVVRLTPADREAGEFFAQPPTLPSGKGTGLFHTDYFKPPATPPAPPKPPAPTERQAPVVYRGLLDLGDGVRMAYLLVDDKPVQRVVGEVVVGAWKLAAFTSGELTLAKDEKTVTIKFNQRATVPAPIAGGKK